MDFEDNILKRCKIIYQLPPERSEDKLNEIERSINELLGPVDGYLKNNDLGLIKSWKKEDILIGSVYNDMISWYIIEIFKNDGNIEVKTKNKIDQGHLNLNVEEGLQVPKQLIWFLEPNLLKIKYKIHDAIDQLFSDQVFLGPGFFDRYIKFTKIADYTQRAIFKMPLGTPPKIHFIEGRVLTGIKRAIPLVMEDFRSITARYHIGKLRNASQKERRLFYALIDFEIEGKPVYIVESLEGRLLVYLEKNKRITWIEYLDQWAIGEKFEK